jgi:hypothetical protein
MSDKLIIFGPWCGEFSYEMSWWIPEIRSMRKNKYQSYTSLACGFSGRKALYEDFIDEYIIYPNDIEDQLHYPSCAGEHVNGMGDIMPDFLIKYIEGVRVNYLKKFKEVIVYLPNIGNIQQRIFSHHPPGEFINYSVNPKINNNIYNQINNYFDSNPQNTIALMARSRFRNGNIDSEDWNPEHWVILVKKIIEELNLNIISINIPSSHSKGGSLSFFDHKLLKDYKHRILEINPTGEDSVGIQIAILKNTKCSLYGGTGAATLGFLTNTPVFTQQTTDNAFRLNFNWQRNLTNDHKNVRIFAKYNKGKIFNSPVSEMFNNFKEFYESL